MRSRRAGCRSGWVRSGYGRAGSTWLLPQVLENALGEGAGEPGEAGDLLGGCLPQRTHTAEAREQHLLTCRADARDPRQLTRQRALSVQLAVVAVREPVRLVADALQQPERVARAGQAQRVRAAGKVDFLLPLGQRDQGEVVRSRLVGCGLRHRELPLPAIDHRKLGERLPFLDPPAQIPPYDFLHRAEVIIAPVAAHLEAPVLVLVRCTVLERDAARDDLRALHVRDVE